MTGRRIVLGSLSSAMDGGFTAVSNVSRAMATAGMAAEYRLIGGMTVMLHVQRLRLDLPLRGTAGADFGVPPHVLREPDLVEAIEALGYTKTFGNRWERPIDGRGVAAVDLLVPAYTSRSRHTVRVGDVVTTEVPGLAEAFRRPGVTVEADLHMTGGTMLVADIVLPDTEGRLDHAIDPTGGVTKYFYGVGGRVDSVKDPNGAVTGFGYDDAGRIRLTTDPAGVAVGVSYTDAGRVATRSDAAGMATFSYDDAGRQVGVKDALGKITTTGYSPDGLVDSVTTPGGDETVYTYDAAGRLESSTDPGGVVDSVGYTARGEVSWQQRSGRGRVSYTYYPTGTLKTVTDARGFVSSFEYDAVGRRTELKNPLGGVETWSHTLTGQVASHGLVGDPGDTPRVETFDYDSAGRLIERADASGRVESRGYDLAGRMISKTASFGGDRIVESFDYDLAGRLVSATGREGAEAWGYDPAGRLVSATAPGGRVTSYGYDTTGRLNTVGTPDGNGWEFDHDAAGRVTGVAAAARFADTFTAEDGSAPDAAKWLTTSGSGTSIVNSQLRLVNDAGSATAWGLMHGLVTSGVPRRLGCPEDSGQRVCQF